MAAAAKFRAPAADQKAMPETTFDEVPEAAGAADLYTALASLLWNERETLEMLLYKLVQEQLLLAAGQLRWLPKADHEVAEAIRQTRLAEILRAAETERIAVELGLPADATLKDLAEIAPENWTFVLEEHRGGLRALVADVQAAAAEVRNLLNAGANMLRETLDAVTHSVGTYNADGAKVERDFGALLLDARG